MRSQGFQLFLSFFLPVLTFAQGIGVTPVAPVAAVGTSVTITADRPVLFRLTGSGSLSTTTGTNTTYTAPATMTASHAIGGCMAAPNDSVFNVRVDNLPLNTNSGSWTPMAIVNGVGLSFGWGINVVDQTAQVAPQQFALTPDLNGAPFPVLSPLMQKRENGSLTTDSTVDHHLLILNQSTCQFYETNQTGINVSGCPTCTAQSGWTYSSTSYKQPVAASTDPAGLPLAPLTLHLSELLSGSINHALRFTACAECVGPQAIWPAITSNGSQNGGAPMGTRFRLKASVDLSSFPTSAYAVLIALKRYGMILAGTSPTPQISVATDVTEDAAIYQQLQTIVAANLNASDFEAVDESSLQLAAGSYAVNPSNPYEKPNNYATLTITDAANAQNVVTVPIAVQPVAVGTSESMMVVQGGTATFQIPHWVTSAANTAATWTISPSTGAGTVTGDGFYTPPAVVTATTNVMLQATSSADTTQWLRFYITLIPNGGVRIDSGSTTGSQDGLGLTWSPDMGVETGNFSTVNDDPSTWGGAVNAAAVSSYLYTSGGDIAYRLRVPNGNYQVSLTFGVGACQGQYPAQIPNQNAVWGPLNVQSQNALVYPNWDFSSAIGSACRTPQTVNMPAQVTNGILTFAVRSSTVNGLDSAPLLNAVSILPTNQVVNPSIQASAVPAAPANLTYTPMQFDAGCGQPGYNCQNAFQFAFATLAQAGGGTLQLPAGTFTINFPGVSSNSTSGVTLTRKNLIVVSPNTMIQGHVAADGTPNTIIQWQNTSVPVFIFDKASHSGMSNLHLQFTGTMANAYPYGDIALLTALGYNPTFPHLNQMSGNNGEMFSFAYVFDSDGCIFDHLIFDSATHDNAHMYSMAINLKGKGVVTTNGGGLTQLAESNRVTSVKVYDFYNGFLVAGQDNFLMQNIVADRRGSSPNSSPGHLLYTTSTNLWDANANLVQTFLSTNMTVQNLIEGPDTYSNASSGGTLAIKFLNGARINNVMSQHPEGLIQTIYVDQNVTFSNMSWKSSYPLCANVPANCSTPAIYSSESPSNLPPSFNLTFENITLVSTASPTTVTLVGDNLRVSGMNITTSPAFLPNQTVMNSVLNVKGTSQASITGYNYTPVLPSYDPTAKYNSPFTGWNPVSNTTAAVTVNWPSAIPVPTGAAIVSPGYQNAGPTYNNQVTTTILTH
jgi:hypothetical protein